MMRIFILYSVVFTSFAAQATQNELKSILTAQSLDELSARERAGNDVQRASENCVAELKARALPRSCFLKIKLQKSSAAAAGLERQRMDRICRETAAHSQSRLDLSGPSGLFSDGCRAVIAKRIEDLRYTDEEAHPELSAARTLGPDLEE